MNTEIQKARQARRCLSMVCQRLQRPSMESWNASQRDLTTAIGCLGELEQILLRMRGSGPPSQLLTAEMAAIRSQISQVQELLLAVGKFYQGWGRLLGIGAEEESANYTPHGTAASVVSINSGQVVMHG